MTRYRVWVHPKRGDDYYHTFTSLSKATKFSKRHSSAELPLRAYKNREYSIPKSKLQKALKKR